MRLVEASTPCWCGGFFSCPPDSSVQTLGCRFLEKRREKDKESSIVESCEEGRVHPRTRSAREGQIQAGQGVTASFGIREMLLGKHWGARGDRVFAILCCFSFILRPHAGQQSQQCVPMCALPLGISPQDPCAAIVALHAERMDIPPGDSRGCRGSADSFVAVRMLLHLGSEFSSLFAPLLVFCAGEVWLPMPETGLGKPERFCNPRRTRKPSAVRRAW